MKTPKADRLAALRKMVPRGIRWTVQNSPGWGLSWFADYQGWQRSGWIQAVSKSPERTIWELTPTGAKELGRKHPEVLE